MRLDFTSIAAVGRKIRLLFGVIPDFHQFDADVPPIFSAPFSSLFFLGYGQHVLCVLWWNLAICRLLCLPPFGVTPDFD